MFGYTVTTSKPLEVLTFADMTGGMIENLGEYECLVQKVGAANVIEPQVAKTSTGITLAADNGGTYHLVFFGFNPTKPHRRHSGFGKWAWDYCPSCKAMKYKAIVGSIFQDIATFAFKVTTDGAGLATVLFRNAMDSTGAYVGLGETELYETGQQKPYLVSQMANANYHLAVTKSHPIAGAVVVSPWVDLVTKAGFRLHGDASVQYDVLVLGQIQY